MRTIRQNGNGGLRGDVVPARALGWFSIALGTAEIVAPKRIGAFLGMADRSAIVRACGLREIGTGVGILAPRDPALGLWARVGGDVLDLATLGSALGSRNPRRWRARVATGAVAAITAVDVAAAQAHQDTNPSANWSKGQSAGIEIQRSISIDRSPQELYDLWKDPRTLNQVLGHVADVSPVGEDRMRWIVQGAPFGRTPEWETRVVAESPGSSIRWESLPGGSIRSSGEVTFRPAPGDWGTEVTLSLTLDPPGGPLGAAVLRLAGPAPKLVVGKALRRFKSLAETGEIPVLDRQPASRKGGRDD